MEFATRLVDIELEHPVMNAAGTCKVLEGDHGIHALARSATSAIMVGSITVAERDGNLGDTYAFDDVRGFSLNSLGLPCRGQGYYTQNLPEMVTVAHDANKPLFVSIAGFSPGEYRELAALAFQGGADLVEVNLGCPNVWHGGEQKRIACFNADLVAHILNAIEAEVGTEARIAVKVSPFSDPYALAEIAGVLSSSKLVKAVTTMNTFPNAFAFADGGREKPLISVGLAGLAGPALKPVGLGQVKQLRALLPNRIQIMGVGGIRTGDDVLDYLAAGASCAQIATTFFQEGPRVFSRILEEMVAQIDK